MWPIGMCFAGGDGYTQKASIPVKLSFDSVYCDHNRVIPYKVTDETLKTDAEYLEWLGFARKKRQHHDSDND